MKRSAVSEPVAARCRLSLPSVDMFQSTVHTVQSKCFHSRESSRRNTREPRLCHTPEQARALCHNNTPTPRRRRSGRGGKFRCWRRNSRCQLGGSPRSLHRQIASPIQHPSNPSTRRRKPLRLPRSRRAPTGPGWRRSWPLTTPTRCSLGQAQRSHTRGRRWPLMRAS